MAKKLVKHGNRWALVIDKKSLSALGVDETNLFDVEIKGKALLVKPVEVIAKKKTTVKKETFDQMADRLMDKYEPLLKKLAKT